MVGELQTRLPAQRRVSLGLGQISNNPVHTQLLGHIALHVDAKMKTVRGNGGAVGRQLDLNNLSTRQTTKQ